MVSFTLHLRLTGYHKNLGKTLFFLKKRDRGQFSKEWFHFSLWEIHLYLSLLTYEENVIFPFSAQQCKK